VNVRIRIRFKVISKFGSGSASSDAYPQHWLNLPLGIF
jgi:hypothetical protein